MHVLAHFLLASLLIMTSAESQSADSPLVPPPFAGAPTRVTPAQQQRARIKAAEKARVKAIISQRQTSRKKLNGRRIAEEAVVLVRRACTAIVYAAKTSSPVYPTCSNSLGTGYARYTGWNLTGDDLPGNPIMTSDQSEKSCIAACNAYKTNGDLTCVGIGQALPRTGLVCTVNPLTASIGLPLCDYPCYLKNKYLCEGTWTSASNFAVDLKGGCAAWQGLVPTNVDSTCCNN